jgi:K+-transporting ATPase ATPase A chain
MTLTGCVEILVLVAVLTALTPLLGGYMARVYQGEAVALSGVLGPVERTIYRLLRVDTDAEQSWNPYARSLIFLVGFVLIFAVLTFLSVLVLAPFAQALSSHLLR